MGTIKETLKIEIIIFTMIWLISKILIQTYYILIKIDTKILIFITLDTWLWKSWLC